MVPKVMWIKDDDSLRVVELLTQIFLHVDFEDLDVLILVEPFVDVQVKVAAVADGFAFEDYLLAEERLILAYDGELVRLA